MQYWCEIDCPGGYLYGYDVGNGYYGHYGEGFYSGKGFGFSPSMLVTGVKLEEVVLNAVLV